MKYDELLAAGNPIGSGFAAGACHHLVKDRMEGTGMRWTVPGAQAMLDLRAVYLNGRWDEYIEYRAETEQTRLSGKLRHRDLRVTTSSFSYQSFAFVAYRLMLHRLFSTRRPEKIVPLFCRIRPTLVTASRTWLVAFVILGGASLQADLLEAAPLQAVVSGGRISGDWGGTAFADASYTVTAGYDPNLVQSGTLAGFPATFVVVSPTITIDTGSGPRSGTLQPFAGFTWHLFSLAVAGNDSRWGFAPIDLSLNVTNAFDIAAPLPQSTLLAQVAFGGDSDANDPVTWQTSLGVLEITASTDAAGTFAIVPEPSTVAALGIAFIPIACRRRFIRA